MSASDKAREEQGLANGREDYPVQDEWQNGQLQEGDIVYRWEVEDGKGGNFYTTTEEVERCTDQTTGEVDAHQLGDRLQVGAYQSETGDTSYKGQLSAYEVQKDTDVATGTCKGNTCYGEGGGDQVYIPNDDNLKRREDLDKPINSESTKVDVEKYEKQQSDLESLQKQEQSKTANVENKSDQSNKAVETSTGADESTANKGKIAGSVGGQSSNGGKGTEPSKDNDQSNDESISQ